MSNGGAGAQSSGHRQLVVLPPEAVLAARMPTPGERRRFNIPTDVPVFDVGGQVFPADRYGMKVADE